MKCYNCGCTLSEKDFCTSCRADVALYKKIMYTSNYYYNEGLEKANVRDLSGAIVSLRQSLKLNKHNIEARNLLGLVYFERGQVAAALSEWVISKNFRSQKNIADDYINAVQNNVGRFESINQAIKKYNKSLEYCQQESYDLAVIQLKKVISLNPKYVEAHQLLALLYIRNEEWEKARKILLKCFKIDTNNTITLSYLKEVNLMLDIEEGTIVPKKKKAQSEDAVTYQSGNETIIQPLNVKDPIPASSIVNLIIGLLIGVAACYFLICPAIISSEENKFIDQLKIVSENSDAKTAKISELEQTITKLEEEKNAAASQIEELTGNNGSVQAIDALLDTTKIYMEEPQNLDKLQEALLKIDTEYIDTKASDKFKEVYQFIIGQVGKDIADKLCDAGSLALNQNDYTVAIENFNKAWYFNKEDGTILYELAQAYRLAEDKEKAKETYEKVIELFPDTENATKAQEYLEEDTQE